MLVRIEIGVEINVIKSGKLSGEILIVIVIISGIQGTDNLKHSRVWAVALI